jgi:hypothetical protein
MGAKRQRFQARVLAGGKQLYLGRWPSQREADIARDRAILKLKLDWPLRRPKEARKLGAATPKELVAEARALEKMGKSSRFEGVNWDGRKKTWTAGLQHRGKRYALTSFREEEAAAVARDRLALHLWGKAAQLNFPKRRLKATSFEQLQSELREQRTASKYRGVSYDPNVQRFAWAAAITLDYEAVFLGRYATERDAAVAYDRAALYYLGTRAKLNLPKVSRAMKPATAEQLRREVRVEFKKLTKSRFRGVKPNRNLWAARIRHRGKEHYLGSFVDDEEAAAVYDKAAVRLHGARARLNFDVG